MIPSFGIKCCFSCLFVLVITEHNIQAASQNFAGNIFRVRTVNLKLLVDDILTAATYHLLFPVGIGNNGGTLCSTITYGITEANVVEQLLNFLVECSTAYNYRIEVVAKDLCHFVANTLADTIAKNRDVQHESYFGILYSGQNSLANNLLNNERNSNNYNRFDVGQRLHQNSWRSNLCQEIHMNTMHEFEDKLKRHAIHVCHRQHAENLIAGLNFVSEFIYGKIQITPKSTIWNHHTL